MSTTCARPPSWVSRAIRSPGKTSTCCTYGVSWISSRIEFSGSDARTRAIDCGLNDEPAKPTSFGLASLKRPKSVESMTPAGPDTLVL